MLYIPCNDGTDNILWNGSKEDGNVWCVKKMEGTDCEDEDSDIDE